MRRRGRGRFTPLFDPSPGEPRNIPVFVYGSLLSGLGNHRVLTQHWPHKLGPGRTLKAEFRMVGLGGFPAVSEGGVESVVGEVYMVTKEGFADLDSLEGYPGFYDRMRVQVVLGDGRTMVDPWMYVLRGREARRTTGPHVPRGDWRAWTEANWTRDGWRR
jgi:gamma-glutamylcyclotransferase (GGCT)/AIG2-like uncharacterized protein YtfP